MSPRLLGLVAVSLLDEPVAAVAANPTARERYFETLRAHVLAVSPQRTPADRQRDAELAVELAQRLLDRVERSGAQGVAF